MMRIFLCFILLLYAPDIFSQAFADSISGVTLIGSDKLGNVYAAIESDVIKIDPSGKKLNNFSKKDFGPVSQIDARDPLRVHLYYRDFGMLRILDNQMGETTVLDLRAAGLTAPVVIANAVDGGIWIYESVNNQLYKYDERLQKQLLAINMFQFSGKVLNPLAMKASDNWLVLLTGEEIYLFDRFGNYARTLPLQEPTLVLKIEDQQLWYSTSAELIGLNLRLNAETRSTLPASKNILQLEITKENQWILSENGQLYRFPRR